MDKNTFIDNFAELFDDTPKESITYSTGINDIEEWSSLVALASVAMINEKYGVRIKGDEIDQCNTVQDLFDLVEKKKNG